MRTIVMAALIAPLLSWTSTEPRPREADYSLTAQADRVAGALEALRSGPAIVVAHSVGASIAMRLAYRHPHRVAAIVSLDGGISAAEIDQLRASLPSFALETVPGAGNFVFEEQPRAVVAAVQQMGAASRVARQETRP